MILCKIDECVDYGHSEKLKHITKIFVEHPEIGFGFLSSICIDHFGYDNLIDAINFYLHS